LENEAKKVGITFEFDDAGNVINYKKVLEGLYDELSAAETEFNSLNSKDAQDKFQESTLTPINEKIELIKDLLSQYDDTRELVEDLDNEIEDKMNEW
jgi:hypothetical protein